MTPIFYGVVDARETAELQSVGIDMVVLHAQYLSLAEAEGFCRTWNDFEFNAPVKPVAIIDGKIVDLEEPEAGDSAAAMADLLKLLKGRAGLSR